MNFLHIFVFLFSIFAVFAAADLSIDGESLVLSINDDGPIKVRRARSIHEH